MELLYAEKPSNSHMNVLIFLFCTLFKMFLCITNHKKSSLFWALSLLLTGTLYKRWFPGKALYSVTILNFFRMWTSIQDVSKFSLFLSPYPLRRQVFTTIPSNFWWWIVQSLCMIWLLPIIIHRLWMQRWQLPKGKLPSIKLLHLNKLV